MAGEKRKMTVAVTGAARGIGLEVARVLASRGHRLALADLDGELAADAAAALGGEARAAALDVRDRAGFAGWLAAVEQELGPLDVLVNCAGICPSAPTVLEQSPEAIRQVIEINLLGTINGSVEAVKLMKPRGRGQVINIASLAGLMGVPGLAAYSASKHGVIGFTESLRAEQRESGIVFSVVMPGPTATRMMDGAETGPVVKLMSPERLAARIAGLVGTRRSRLASPRLDGALARLAGNLPPRLALRISRLLRADRIYTHVDRGQRREYESWLSREG